MFSFVSQFISLVLIQHAGWHRPTLLRTAL